MTTASSSESPGGGQAPMYAPSVQQAIESGDLPRMKTLAREAQQYLHHAKAIEPLAKRLNAEIERIEGRS